MVKTKKGKGTRIVAVTDAAGAMPICLRVHPAFPHKVTLAEKALKDRFIIAHPERLIGDKAHGSAPLDERLKEQVIDLIAPAPGWPQRKEDTRW